jgi:hypothetical protein
MQPNNFNNYAVSELAEKIIVSQKAFLRKVYGWMSVGLLITTFVSFFFFTSGLYLSFLTPTTLIIFFVLQLGAVIALSGWAMKMSSPVAIFTFIVYSALTGITLSSIFFLYNLNSIISTFLIASITFAALSIYGFITKKDLTAFGSFLFVGLIGIIVAMVVNFFLMSSALNFVISFIGVLVFAGLTAYDTQKLKEMHLVQLQGSEIASKASIIGALTLYLDFINLFLMLLRIFGGGRD